VRAPGTCVLFLALLPMLAGSRVSAAGKAVEGAVNLNTAGPEVLGLLPGIGPAKALSIVAYRTKRPFRTVDELVRIKGIGRKMVRALRPHLAVTGPTTAAQRDPRRAAAPPPTTPPPTKLAVPAPHVAICQRILARQVRPAVQPAHVQGRGHGACLPAR
jgi:competence protein ComEA